MTLEVAAKIAEVSESLIRVWVHRGVINRYDSGYSQQELLDRVDTRNIGKVIGAMKATHRRVYSK